MILGNRKESVKLNNLDIYLDLAREVLSRGRLYIPAGYLNESGKVKYDISKPLKALIHRIRPIGPSSSKFSLVKFEFSYLYNHKWIRTVINMDMPGLHKLATKSGKELFTAYLFTLIQNPFDIDRLALLKSEIKLCIRHVYFNNPRFAWRPAWDNQTSTVHLLRDVCLILSVDQDNMYHRSLREYAREYDETVRNPAGRDRDRVVVQEDNIPLRGQRIRLGVAEEFENYRGLRPEVDAEEAPAAPHGNALNQWIRAEQDPQEYRQAYTIDFNNIIYADTAPERGNH